MLTTETIRTLFVALNDELASRGVLGEVGLCGGAVMCLVFQARNSTKDVDAVFEPTTDHAQNKAWKMPKKTTTAMLRMNRHRPQTMSHSVKHHQRINLDTQPT